MNPPPTAESHAGSTIGPPTLERRLTNYRAMLAVFWTLVILMLCWLPKEVLREVEDDSSWFQIPNFDKVVHWGIFLLFTMLWLPVWSSRWRFLWVGLAGLVLAVVSEAGQAMPIVGRDASVADAVTDVIGVLLGLVLAPAIEPLVQRVESLILRKSTS